METLLGKLINNSVRTNASNTLMYFANSILTVIFKLREPEDSVPTIGKSSKHQFNMFAMPTPTPAMLANDPIWDAICELPRPKGSRLLKQFSLLLPQGSYRAI